MIFRPGQAQYNISDIQEIQIIQTPSADVAWWLAGGTISGSNVKEHVELPAAGQLYAGGAITGAWTLAVRTTWNGSNGQFIFDSQLGRMVLGVDGAGSKSIFVGTWQNSAVLNASDSVYFLVSDGANIQAYRNNSAVGSAVASAADIGNTGLTAWRSRYDNSASTPWATPVPRGAVYDIALDSTQRPALYASMLS